MQPVEPQGECLLVVDPDETTEVTVREVARTLAWTVHVSPGGTEALQAALAMLPVAVVVDLGERRVTAPELVSAIVRRLPDAIVLATGSSTDVERIVGVMRAGATTFLPAPPDRRRLARVLREESAARSRTLAEQGPPAGSTITPLDELEREHVLRALEVCQGNFSETARALGIGRTTLYRKLERYGIKPPAAEVELT